MTAEPGPPPASQETSYKVSKDFVSEIETRPLSVQTETQLSTSPTVASQASAIGHPFLPEDGDAGADCAVSDAVDPLSRFSSEAEVNDITQEPLVRVMLAGIETAKIDSVAFADLRGELRRIEEATNAAERRSAAAAKSESVALADLRGQLRETEMVVKQSAEEAGAFRRELDQLREVAVRLTGEYNRIEDATRRAQERSAMSIQDLSSSTDARLATLNALAEQVTRKAEALESQKDKIDYALAKGNRVAEMVSAMEARIAMLNKGNQLIERTDEMQASELAQVTKVKNEFESHLARFAKRVHTLTESARSHVEEPVMTMLRPQQTPRRSRHHRAVIGGLGVLVLASLIVSRSLGDADQIAGQPVVTHAPPVSAASALVLPELMRSTTVPILPQPMLSTARPTMRIAKTTTSQPPLKLQRPVVVKSPRTPVRSPEFIGTLDIRSEPMGAAVFINRQRVGETPIRLPKLRAGSHVIWIEREGYQRWTAAARVVSDTVTRFDVKLQLEPVLSGIE